MARMSRIAAGVGVAAAGMGTVALMAEAGSGVGVASTGIMTVSPGMDNPRYSRRDLGDVLRAVHRLQLRIQLSPDLLLRSDRVFPKRDLALLLLQLS